MQRTEGHVDQLSVGNDRDAAVKERVKHELAVHVLVANIVRVHGHSGVAQHCLRTRRRHHDLATVVLELVRKAGDDAKLNRAWGKAVSKPAHGTHAEQRWRTGVARHAELRSAGELDVINL
jgi:hypothetical protein